MLRLFSSLLLLVWLSNPAATHEFWIEPDRFFAPLDSNIKATVRVGQQLDGKAFEFEPRAYQIALWVGPDKAHDLTRVHLRSGDVSLPPLGTGLHVLAVTSFSQPLVYETFEEFINFTQSIEQPALVDIHLNAGLPQTSIREKYRRLSKTLVHYGMRVGEDRRIGIPKEWVFVDGGFTLFDDLDPAPGRKVQVFCRQGTGIVSLTRQSLTTDATGTITPSLPKEAQCLINTVFLERGTNDVHWNSDWVSIFFATD